MEECRSDPEMFNSCDTFKFAQRLRDFEGILNDIDEGAFFED